MVVRWLDRRPGLPRPQAPQPQPVFRIGALGGVSLGGFDETAVAEQGGGEVGEGLEMLGFAVVAAHESAVA